MLYAVVIYFIVTPNNWNDTEKISTAPRKDDTNTSKGVIKQSAVYVSGAFAW